MPDGGKRMRCNKRKEAAFLKKNAYRTQIKMLTSNPALCTQKALFLGRIASDCGALCCVRHAKACGKPLFPLIIDLCAHSIMNAAP